MDRSNLFQKDSTIYLNLNKLIDSESEFIDSFEHELWHHLLSFQEIDKLHKNLWLEGFIEGWAELWSTQFCQVAKNFKNRKLQTIQYPTQTAFASLFIGVYREEILLFLAGIVNETYFAEQLTNDFNQQEDIDSFKKLIWKTFQDSQVTAKAKKSQIENILTNWSWKEDDYSNVKIERFLKGTKLFPEALTSTFMHEKPFFFDFVKALTLVNLNILTDAIPEHKLPGFLDLPERLRDNLSQALRISRDMEFE